MLSLSIIKSSFNVIKRCVKCFWVVGVVVGSIITRSGRNKCNHEPERAFDHDDDQVEQEYRAKNKSSITNENVKMVSTPTLISVWES